LLEQESDAFDPSEIYSQALKKGEGDRQTR